MGKIPTVEISGVKKVVHPVLLVALNSAGELVPVKVTADGKIKS